MVDLETHKIIDRIESREVDDVRRWLAEYPNLSVVSRDGSQAYASAITEAHPRAMQVSDRFHLMKNLNNYATKALQKLFQGRIAIPITDETQRIRNIMLIGTKAERIRLIKNLRNEGRNLTEISTIVGTTPKTVERLLTKPNENAESIMQTIRGREHDEAVKKLQKRAEEVRSLHSKGYSLLTIAQKTGFATGTIRNYLSSDFSPMNAHYGKQREGKLEPFREQVISLKSEGKKYREIFEIIKIQGYTGTQDAIRGFISKERRIRRDLQETLGGSTEFIDKKWFIRLLYQPIEKVKGISQGQLDSICSLYPDSRSILSIVDEFKTVLKSKDPQTLPLWIEKAASLGLPEINTFINGLKLDMNAVINAIATDFSNGLAEGTVNKIKVIKRIMYGRCKFSLLRNKSLLLDYFK